MSEFEKLMRRIAARGYKVIGTREKDFGQRLVCEWKRHVRTDRRMLVYHFYKKEPTVYDFDEFVKDFEKFSKQFSSNCAIEGGLFITHSKYNKKGFNIILNRLDDDVRRLIHIKSLREERMPKGGNGTIKKVPPLSQKKKEILIHNIGTKCCYPHCREKIALDVHHITPREEGGTNRENNLVVLCPTHHRMARDGTIPRQRLKLYSVAKKKK
jgi:5-methylcytosine-specific restriction endonuclease McrA